jgi:S1-C subfamily serine protease
MIFFFVHESRRKSMKTQALKPVLWLGILILFIGMACNLGTATEKTAVPTVEPTKETLPTQAEIAPTEPPAAAEGTISTREDAEKAIVQIVAQGSIVSPEFGDYEGIGSGSGFLIDSSGLAVTNNHVVTGAALLKVYFSGDSKAYNAKVLGVSECSDLAVIDIEGGGYPYLQWHDGEVKVGTQVWSAGYPFGEPEYSLHRGVISKEHASGASSWASISSVVEHDATINPGNSGGPLLDDNGKVVGINYASATSAANMYYAISRNEADPILQELIKGNNVNSEGINGVAVASDDGTITGIWVNSVASGSPADQAGLKGGDIILKMEGIQLARDGTMEEYCDILRTHKPFDTLGVTVLRYSEGQLLEGQLNGRELAVTGTFDTSGTTGNTGSTTSDNGGYFREEFDGDPTDWTYFFTSGEENESKFNLYTDNGKFSFEENAENIWAYATYDKYIYTDVRLDTSAENLGRNTNSVSLMCRYDENLGWYEFNIGSDGLYSILRYENGNGYTNLADGGSNLIKMGKDTNEYTIICQGDTLTLGINGYEVKSVRDKTFKEGLIGLSVSSYDVFPVLVDFAYLDISQP